MSPCLCARRCEACYPTGEESMVSYRTHGHGSPSAVFSACSACEVSSSNRYVQPANLCSGRRGAVGVGVAGGSAAWFGRWALWAPGAALAGRGWVQHPCGWGGLVYALVRWRCGTPTWGGLVDLAHLAAGVALLLPLRSPLAFSSL